VKVLKVPFLDQNHDPLDGCDDAIPGRQDRADHQDAYQRPQLFGEAGLKDIEQGNGSPASDFGETRLRKITFSTTWPPHTLTEGGQAQPVSGDRVYNNYYLKSSRKLIFTFFVMMIVRTIVARDQKLPRPLIRRGSLTE